MQIFVQPEDLCIVKAKKMRDMFITFHYIVIKSWISPRQERETTKKKENQKKKKKKYKEHKKIETKFK